MNYLVRRISTLSLFISLMLAGCNPSNTEEQEDKTSCIREIITAEVLDGKNLQTYTAGATAVAHLLENHELSLIHLCTNLILLNKDDFLPSNCPKKLKEFSRNELIETNLITIELIQLESKKSDKNIHTLLGSCAADSRQK